MYIEYTNGFGEDVKSEVLSTFVDKGDIFHTTFRYGQGFRVIREDIAATTTECASGTDVTDWLNL